MRRNALRWGGAVAVAIGLAGLADGPHAAAQGADAPPAIGVAASDGVRLGFFAHDYVVTDQLVELGAPTAQASIDGVGSTGYAAFPSPGALALSAPGLIAGQSGVPIPDYPLYVQSADPDKPKAHLEQGTVQLDSDSGPSTTHASAAGGGPASDQSSAGASHSDAEVTLDDTTETMHARSQSTIESFSVGGVLRIGRAEAVAEVTAPVGGAPKIVSSFAATGVTVLDQPVQVTDQGLAFPGGNVPLPTDNPLSSILDKAGIHVTYLAPEQTADGVVSAGLRIEMAVPLPNSPNPGVVTYELGRASARGRGGIRAAAGGGIPAAAGDDFVPSISTASPAASPSAPEASGATATGPTPVVAAPAPSKTGAVPIVARTFDSTAFYLVLVFGGIVAFAGSQLIRILAVRLAWTS